MFKNHSILSIIETYLVDVGKYVVQPLLINNLKAKKWAPAVVLVPDEALERHIYTKQVSH